jgi:predicted TIM-barrel fold metal-dependent hydrolase
MRHAIPALVAALFALGPSRQEKPPPPKGPWELAGEGRYLAALALAEREHEANPRDPQCADQLGIMRSFVGDGAGALEIFEAMGGAPSPVALDAAEAATLAACTPCDALAEIVAAAKDRQVVILNEAHHVPLHRAFSLEVARALRKEGFEYFAAETFTRDTESLRKRGTPTRSTGFYSAEPAFGELIRQVLALGYAPVAYEMESRAPAGDGNDSINFRESEQCKNLVERIFRDHPKARVLIHVGYSHATEDWRKLPDGREVGWMAARLAKTLAIDPLTIDQTEQMPASRPERATAAWRFAQAKDWLTTPRILRRKDGSAYVGGSWRGRVDLQIFHPEVKLVDGRPDWLTRDGQRKPVEIPAEADPKSGRVLVQAFVAKEGADAIPVDQVVLVAGEPAPVLLVPDGEFRLVVQDEKGANALEIPLAQ